MPDPITQAQQTYILALLEEIDRERFEKFKRELKISEEVQISDLSKDEAYKLISKMVPESSPQSVEKALAAAIEAYS